MAEYSARQRDIAIARGLGHSVYLIVVNSGYERGEEIDLECSKPVPVLVPVMCPVGGPETLHDAEFLGGHMRYTLNVVPNYDADSEELLYISSCLEDQGWSLYGSTKHDDGTWSCTYAHSDKGRVMANGNTELAARANCICIVLNGDDWPSKFTQPEVIVHVPISVLDTKVVEVDDVDE